MISSEVNGLNSPTPNATVLSIEEVESCFCGSTRHTEEEHMDWEGERWEREQEQEEQDRRTEAIVRYVLRQGLARRRPPDPALMNVKEAAHLLGITPGALRKRVVRYQVSGVVRTGKRIQFDRAKLMASISRKAKS